MPREMPDGGVPAPEELGMNSQVIGPHSCVCLQPAATDKECRRMRGRFLKRTTMKSKHEPKEVKYMGRIRKYAKA